jgi:hypothetical protein
MCRFFWPLVTLAELQEAHALSPLHARVDPEILLSCLAVMAVHDRPPHHVDDAS